MVAWPVRGIWVGAVILTLGLIATPQRAADSPEISVVASADGVLSAAPAPAAPMVGGGLPESIDAVIHGLMAAPLRAFALTAARFNGTFWDRLFIAGWVILSAVLLLAFGWTAVYYRKLQRAALPRSFLGAEVRVTAGAGPAVLGFRKPVILLPGWLLTAPSADQRMIVAHELEHFRARDPLVLLLGAAAVVLLPWHPMMWWMASRLRLTTELDCDRRVLRRGADRLSYSRLLIRVAARRSGMHFGALALSSASHLQRRLTAMVPAPKGFTPGRAIVCGLISTAAILAACEASPPTAAAIERLDVAAAEDVARAIGLIAAASEGDDTQYFVNGREVAATVARSIPRQRIATILVRTPTKPDWPSQVLVATTDAPPEAKWIPTEGYAGRHTGYGYIAGDGAADDPNRFETEERPATDGAAGPAPLILIDGRRADAAALEEIRGERTILSVEIVKGPDALVAYGVEGAGGAVLVTSSAKKSGGLR